MISSYYNSIVPTAHSNWWSIIFITMYDVVRSKSQDINVRDLNVRDPFGET